jgi:hypothetical protein
MSFHHRGAEIAEFGIFLVKNPFLCVLRASALKVVADPSFGGSAVSSLLHRNSVTPINVPTVSRYL